MLSIIGLVVGGLLGWIYGQTALLTLPFGAAAYWYFTF